MGSGLVLWCVKSATLCLVGKTCVPLCRVLTCVDHSECRTLTVFMISSFILVLLMKRHGRLGSTFVLKCSCLLNFSMLRSSSRQLSIYSTTAFMQLSFFTLIHPNALFLLFMLYKVECTCTHGAKFKFCI